VTAWFYPWKYRSQEEVWRGLLAEVIIACLSKTTDKVAKSDIADFGHFLGKSFLSLLSGVKLKLGIADVDLKAVGEAVKETEDFLHPESAYLNEFEIVLKRWVANTLDPNARMVVFIDDLDRCDAKITLRVLEALKLFLSIEKLIFVVGVDRTVVDQLVRKNYDDFGLSEDKSEDYLAKMFQVEIPIGQVEGRVREFLDSLLERNDEWNALGSVKNAQEVFHNVIRSLTGLSSREAKRLVNISLIAGAGVRLAGEAGVDGKKAGASSRPGGAALSHSPYS